MEVAGLVSYPEGDAVLGAKLLQLSHDAVSDAGRALRVETVHHPLAQIQLRPGGGGEGAFAPQMRWWDHIRN